MKTRFESNKWKFCVKSDHLLGLASQWSIKFTSNPRKKYLLSQASCLRIIKNFIFWIDLVGIVCECVFNSHLSINHKRRFGNPCRELSKFMLLTAFNQNQFSGFSLEFEAENNMNPTWEERNERHNKKSCPMEVTC